MSDQDFSEWREAEVTVKHTFRFRTLKCGSYETDVRAADLESEAHQSMVAQASIPPANCRVNGSGFTTEWLSSEIRNFEIVKMRENSTATQVPSTDPVEPV